MDTLYSDSFVNLNGFTAVDADVGIVDGEFVSTEAGTNPRRIQYNASNEAGNVDTMVVAKCIFRPATALADEFEVSQAGESGSYRRYWASWGSGGLLIRRRFSTDVTVATLATVPAPVTGDTRWLGLRRYYNSKQFEAYLWTVDPVNGAWPAYTLTWSDGDASWDSYVKRGAAVKGRTSGSVSSMDDFRIYAWSKASGNRQAAYRPTLRPPLVGGGAVPTVGQLWPRGK